MGFPVDLSAAAIDERGLFVVQDAKLRSRVLPLFSFDPGAPSERPVGHGTTFRIDPWSQCATAFHVLEDLFEVSSAGSEIILKPNLRLAALELHGFSYGLVRIPDGNWRPLAGSFGLIRIEQPPLATIRLRNFTELMMIRVTPPAPHQDGTPYIPMDFRRWRPRIGERVLALGYADLDTCSDEAEDESRPMSQYLYGSLGNITHIEPADFARGRPWPFMRIDANWPGGMSGGPVFNEVGHVVGLVSAGFAGGGGATATFFSGWDIPERIFGQIDPNNPGRFRCWGVFGAAGELVRYGLDRSEIEQFGRERGLNNVSLVSVDPATSEHMRSTTNGLRH